MVTVRATARCGLGGVGGRPGSGRHRGGPGQGGGTGARWGAARGGLGPDGVEAEPHEPQSGRSLVGGAVALDNGSAGSQVLTAP